MSKFLQFCVGFGLIAVGIPQNSYSVAINERSFGAGNQTTGSYDYNGEVPGTEGMDEMTVVKTLRHDIQLLDEEIATCERKRKGWVAATVVGGVGVVGTGVAALVQNSKIQDKKSELNRVQSDINTTKQDIETARQQLNQK